MKEKLAALSVIIVVFMVPFSIFGYQYIYLPAQSAPNDKVFTITAVGAGSGAYTLEEVNGLNYWWKRFSPMTMLLNVGDHVYLNIRSADVFHQFYIPGLDVGPIDIVPGHLSKAEFKAEKEGVYQYFCTTMCGDCHCYMSGWIVITTKGKPHKHPNPIVCPACFVDYGRPPAGDLVQLGDYLYLRMTCNACHGWEGMGGIKNLNYAKETIPRHDTTAKKFFLREQEDAETFIEWVKENEDMEDPDIPMFKLVQARYNAAKELIKNGSPAEKLDPAGPEPPLWMPAWRYKLTDREIDAILAYFVVIYPWEEEDDDEEDEGNEKIEKEKKPAFPLI